MNEFRSFLTDQIKQLQLQQPSTSSVMLVTSTAPPATENEQEGRIINTRYDSSPITPTPTTSDKSEEIIELIAYMETRNKRLQESSSMRTTPHAEQAYTQAQPLYKDSTETEIPISIDWKSSVDLNHGYTISVYSVMAELSVLTILLFVYGLSDDFSNAKRVTL